MNDSPDRSIESMPLPPAPLIALLGPATETADGMPARVSPSVPYPGSLRETDLSRSNWVAFGRGNASSAIKGSGVRACLGSAFVACILLLISGGTFAHSIEITTQSLRAGQPVTAVMEGLSPTSPSYPEAYVERDGATIRVYGTIGLGVLPAFSSYEFQASLGRLPAGEYEAVYFGRFGSGADYEMWDSVPFGVAPVIAVPALTRPGKVALIVLVMLLAWGGVRVARPAFF